MAFRKSSLWNVFRLGGPVYRVGITFRAGFVHDLTSFHHLLLEGQSVLKEKESGGEGACAFS